MLEARGLRKSYGARAAVADILSATVFALERRIGLVSQDLALFEDLPALANIELFGWLYDLPKAMLKQRAMHVYFDAASRAAA